MKKINTSFILALLVNGGFLCVLLSEQTLFRNWILIGWTINALIVLYFVSLLFALIEIKRKARNLFLYSALVLNSIGLLLFVDFWLRQ
ncbi:hypothetical protein [Brevibacillus borstelensis]|uniref:hypothetical protein n=1 Tax=Brevibacillus borstelensis TaxID=45462 RepID=UPI0030BA61F4